MNKAVALLLAVLFGIVFAVDEVRRQKETSESEREGDEDDGTDETERDET